MSSFAAQPKLSHLGRNLALSVQAHPTLYALLLLVIALVMCLNFYISTRLRPCNSVAQLINSVVGINVCGGQGDNGSVVFKILCYASLIIGILAGLLALGVGFYAIERFRQRKAMQNDSSMTEAPEMERLGPNAAVLELPRGMRSDRRELELRDDSSEVTRNEEQMQLPYRVENVSSPTVALPTS